jgi:hypothetical protein
MEIGGLESWEIDRLPYHSEFLVLLEVVGQSLIELFLYVEMV